MKMFVFVSIILMTKMAHSTSIAEHPCFEEIKNRLNQLNIMSGSHPRQGFRMNTESRMGKEEYSLTDGFRTAHLGYGIRKDGSVGAVLDVEQGELLSAPEKLSMVFSAQCTIESAILDGYKVDVQSCRALSGLPMNEQKDASKVASIVGNKEQLEKACPCGEVSRLKKICEVVGGVNLNRANFAPDLLPSKFTK